MCHTYYLFQSHFGMFASVRVEGRTEHHTHPSIVHWDTLPTSQFSALAHSGTEHGRHSPNWTHHWCTFVEQGLYIGIKFTSTHYLQIESAACWSTHHFCMWWWHYCQDSQPAGSSCTRICHSNTLDNSDWRHQTIPLILSGIHLPSQGRDHRRPLHVEFIWQWLMVTQHCSVFPLYGLLIMIG